MFIMLKSICGTMSVTAKLSNFMSTNDSEHVFVTLRNVAKKPNHMIVVLGTEKPSYRDLANIAVWCVAAGIPYISFYDHAGMLKQNKTEVYNAVIQASLKYNTGSWNRSIAGNILPLEIAKRNGVKSSSVHINVLSLSDGRGAISKLTRDCALNHIDSTNITADYLDEKLKQRFDNTPDPELALCCGNMCGSYGVLPWQVRITEFININTHKNIHVNTFLKSLQLYGNCEQRYGK